MPCPLKYRSFGLKKIVSFPAHVFTQCFSWDSTYIERHIVPNHMVTPLYEPEPSNILTRPHDTDCAIVTEITSQAEMKELWETPNSDFTSHERLFYYWHKRLRHIPKEYIRRLTRRGVLPRCLEHVKRIFFVVCAFVNASKRNWRGRNSFLEGYDDPLD